MTIVSTSISYFPDPARGRPIFNGSVYVGNPDTDPEIVANQKQVTLILEDGSQIQVSQPLSIGAGGVLMYNGSPAQMVVDGEYSIKVLDGSRQVYYIPSNSGVLTDRYLETYEDIAGITDPSSYGSNTPLTLIGNEAVGTKVAGDGVIKNVTSHGITSTKGVQVRIDDDWYWQRIYDSQDGVELEWFGGRGDDSGATDNLEPYNLAKALKQPINIGQGLFYFSEKITTSAAEADAFPIRGAGMSQTVLMFRSTSGVELLGTANYIEHLTIVDGDSYATLPTTEAEAVDNNLVRANIDSSTVGILFDRNQIVAENLLVRGFGVGRKFANTKFYMVNRKVRTDQNLIGMQFGNGFETDQPNFCFSYDCYDGNNFQRNIHGQSGFHVFSNQSSELCEDYSADNVNFPDGGIWIEPKAHAIFNDYYFEEINVYNASEKSVFKQACNIWDAVVFRPTRFEGLIFGDMSRNLIDPPWLQSWRPQTAGDVLIDNNNTNIAGGRRYTRLTATGGVGISKSVFSHWNSAIRGITPQGSDNLEIKIYAGFWVRTVSGTFTEGELFFRPQFEDTSSNLFFSNTTERLVIHDATNGFNRNRSGTSGTATSTTANRLVDSGAAFSNTVMVGMEVFNTTDGSKAIITAINSDTEVSLDGDIFTSGEVYDIAGWQYIGSLHTLRGGGSFANGNPLARCRLTIQIEASSTDSSVSNNVIDIAEPEFRIVSTQGSQINNYVPVQEGVSTVNISSGAVTIVDEFTLIDTEAGAATDDLDTITCQDTFPGKKITISAADSSRTVVVKDGTGNIALRGADFPMDNIADKAEFVDRDGNNTWDTVSLSDNGS